MLYTHQPFCPAFDCPWTTAESSWLLVEQFRQYNSNNRPAHIPRPPAMRSPGAPSTLTATAHHRHKRLTAKRLVVSLASFPGRAEYAAPTVYSIMHGTRKPDVLYFWVTVGVKRWGASTSWWDMCYNMSASTADYDCVAVHCRAVQKCNNYYCSIGRLLHTYLDIIAWK